MSPIIPAPTDKAGDAPIDCMNRQNKSWGIVREEATPKEPKNRRGVAVKYTGFLPSELKLIKCNDNDERGNITESRIGCADDRAQR